MKKKVLSLVLAAAMVMGLAAPALAAEESENGKIVILHTNDVHCGIDPATDEESGAVTNVGYAGVAAYKAEMEAQYGAENVTLVDAGDAIQGGPIGTLSKGSYIVDIMNEVGYDFAIPGNHEFDYGMDNFLTLAKEKAQYTYLCCNFTDLEGKPVLDAYKVVDYGDVSVGYVGIDTPESFTKSTPTYFQNEKGEYIYSFSQGNEGADLYAAVQKAVDAAVADGADYVVALGHLGNEGSTDVWTSKSVIANTTGIDVFIDGHSHEAYDETVQNKDGEDVVLAQTGTKLANIGKVVIDTKTGDITAELVSGYDKQDETVAAYVAKVNEEFAGVLQEVVAKSDVDLTTLDPATGERAVRSAETNLGDLCADAYRVLLGADVAFVNGGGVRADIAAGDITYENIINVHPFGNEACLVETTGQDILDALEMGARLYPEENGGFLQVSGLSYTIDASVPSSVVLNDEGEFVKVDGAYRVKDVMVGDEPLDVTKTYTLASHNYMLKSGGDGFVMFKDDPVLKDCVMIDNQVLINYIVDELGGVVGADYAAPQGRITIVNADQAAETPAEPEAPADWADVAADAWYAEAVNYVIDNGIMGSTSTDAKVFTPDGTVTRATVFQTLYNLEGKPAMGEKIPDGAALVTDENGNVTGWTAFSDIDGTWYADAANWAASTGLAAVPADRTFNGDRAITRAEIATIFARYAEYKGVSTTAGDLSTYADAADVAEWAADGMATAVGSGIISGKPGSLLDPNGTTIRTELATILLNFSKLTPAEVTYTTEAVSIEANGRTIPAVVTRPVGEGPFPAVVLNHGHGGSKDENTGFGGIAKALAEAGIASIRMDFPGCGDSTEPFTENTLSNMIADSNAAKDYLVANYPVDADKLGILGYSMGGLIAAEIVSQEDNPYQAVVLLSGALVDVETLAPNLFGSMETYEELKATAEKDGFATFTTIYGQTQDLSKAWFDDMEAADGIADIQKFDGPVMIMYGDKDEMVTPEMNQAVAQVMPEAQVVIVPDADHGYGFYSDQPEVTAMVEGSITDFFTGNLMGAAQADAA